MIGSDLSLGLSRLHGPTDQHKILQRTIPQTMILLWALWAFGGTIPYGTLGFSVVQFEGILVVLFHHKAPLVRCIKSAVSTCRYCSWVHIYCITRSLSRHLWLCSISQSSNLMLTADRQREEVYFGGKQIKERMKLTQRSGV